MIGSSLKKLSAEYGLKVDRGVAYGNLQGFAATMCEGSRSKQIILSTSFADPVQKTMFLDAVQAVDIKKQYMVINLNVANDGIQIEFLETIGVMAKIREFLAWFLPLLQQYQATPWNVCPECGCEITVGKWMLINGVARFMHDSCAAKATRDVEDANERREQEDNGTYLKGTIGALIGAMLGAVVWALVLLAGYVASIIGLLIGWLSNKGYDLLHGKKGKGKVVILIIAVILGVVIGTLGADAITLAQMINAGELADVTMADIPAVILVMLLGNAEYLSVTVSNIGMGLLFAALGVYWLVIRAGKEVAGEKIAELK